MTSRLITTLIRRDNAQQLSWRQRGRPGGSCYLGFSV